MTDSAEASLAELARNYDVHDERIKKRHHEVLDYMRSQGPVVRADTYGGHWVLVGYDAVQEAALDGQTFSSASGTILGSDHEGKFKPNELDLPEARPWRNIMAPFFTKKVADNLIPPITVVADELLDKLAGNRSFDVLTEYAKPVVHYAVFREVMGFDADQTAFCVDAVENALFGSDEETRLSAWGRLVGFCSDFWDAKQDQPVDGGLVDAIRTGDIDGEPVTKEDFIGWSIQMIAGGVETTPFALGNLFVHLAEHTDVRHKAAQDGAYLRNTIDESLRFESPAIWITRTLTKDIEFQGQQMKEGDKALLVWAAGNRDEAMFEDSTTFNPGRCPIRHLAFGQGVHRCVGERVALSAMIVATRELLARFPDFSLDPDNPVVYKMGPSRGPSSLPIVVS